MHINQILDNFSFGIQSEKFEAALKDLGEMLGYISQRPDQEIRKGPDNLWGISYGNYVIFECKSEVDENRNAINKSEAGQFNSSCGWFKDEYGQDAKVLPIMIIPTRRLAYEANFNEEVFIMKKNGIKEFKKNIKGFIKEIKNYKLDSISDEKIQEYFNQYKLNITDFKDNYIEEIFHITK